MDCNNTNLKRGSKGTLVKELQTLLTNKKLYTGRIDGDYGRYTEQAVKQYQKTNGLLVDGIFGPVTCKKLQTTTTNNKYPTSNGDTTGIYTSYGHFPNKGCDKLGQCTSYYCGPHAIHQAIAKQDLEQYADEYKLAGWCGTTTAGTSHAGIETALYELSRRSGMKIQVEWKNLSDLATNLNEQMRQIGKIIEQPNKFIIHHILYRGKYGHYETIKEVNMNNKTLQIMNSLGNKCGSTSYCGYMETRTFSTQQSYYRGISQKSLCIITFGG